MTSSKRRSNLSSKRLKKDTENSSSSIGHTSGHNSGHTSGHNNTNTTTPMTTGQVQEPQSNELYQVYDTMTTQLEPLELEQQPLGLDQQPLELEQQLLATTQQQLELSSKNESLQIIKKAPVFLQKLYAMLNDVSLSDISWSLDGSYFTVNHPDSLAKTVLPFYFKHNNFTSFIRQLNMYGFRKFNQAAAGGLLNSGSMVANALHLDSLAFKHDDFRRGREDLIALITRRKGYVESEQSLAATLELLYLASEWSAKLK